MRQLAERDPEMFLAVALETGVLAPAGFLRDDSGRLDPTAVEWWPIESARRFPVYSEGSALAKPVELDEPTSDCPLGKRQYATKGAAREHRDRLRRERGDRTISVYRGMCCGTFHVGHTSRADKKESMR